MKYFPMIGHMDTEALKKFLEFANENGESEWTVVLNTAGGEFFVSEAMARMINNHSQNVEIIVQGAFSSGFMLLMETKCKKILSKSCRGMWHYGKWSLEFNDKNKPYYYDDEAIIRNLPFHKRQSESIARKVMNKKEWSDFKKDRDVYFDTKRMREIFPDAEIMK